MRDPAGGAGPREEPVARRRGGGPRACSPASRSCSRCWCGVTTRASTARCGRSCATRTRRRTRCRPAWVRAYQHLGEFAGAAAFSTWLVRIAANEALGRLRGRARLVRPEEEEEEARWTRRREDPEERAAAREAVRLVERAVDGLTAALPRSCSCSATWSSSRPRETAEALGLGEEAVKVRLHRARAMLRRALGETGRAGRARGVPVPRAALQPDGGAGDGRDRRLGPRHGRGASPAPSARPLPALGFPSRRPCPAARGVALLEEHAADRVEQRVAAPRR